MIGGILFRPVTAFSHCGKAPLSHRGCIPYFWGNVCDQGKCRHQTCLTLIFIHQVYTPTKSVVLCLLYAHSKSRSIPVTVVVSLGGSPDIIHLASRMFGGGLRGCLVLRYCQSAVATDVAFHHRCEWMNNCLCQVLSVPWKVLYKPEPSLYCKVSATFNVTWQVYVMCCDFYEIQNKFMQYKWIRESNGLKAQAWKEQRKTNINMLVVWITWKMCPTSFITEQLQDKMNPQQTEV